MAAKDLYEKDYYAILGVDKNADGDAIKKQYRKLARELHPDKTKGDKTLEERFKAVSEAYDILSDDKKRAEYDQARTLFQQGGIPGGGFQGNFSAGGFGDLGDIFGNLFGGQSRGPRRGDDLRFDLNISFKEAVFGQEKEIQIRHLETCNTCKGSGAKAGSGPVNCSTCGGSGQVRRATRTPFGTFTQVAPCPACEGNGQMIADPCSDCAGQGVQQVRKKLRINIPAGVDSGTRLRVNNEGNAGMRGGPSGDLYVVLFVQADAKLRRDGIHINSELPISYLQAILGDRLQVETVDGPEEFQIPPGTQPGTVLTLKDRGVPRLGNPVARGNHMFTIKVVVPQKLEAKERELLEELNTIARSHPKGKGLFGGLFQ